MYTVDKLYMTIAHGERDGERERVRWRKFFSAKTYLPASSMRGWSESAHEEGSSKTNLSFSRTKRDLHS